MSDLESQLNRYKMPSSPTEKEKQRRAERMARRAIAGWVGFEGVRLSLVSKGSYPNRTNVRLDSDVDIAVVQNGFHYRRDDDSGQLVLHEGLIRWNGPRYEGEAFRMEVEKSLRARFNDQCDTSGKTAIRIRENSGRVSADVVPSFHYREHRNKGYYRETHRGLITRRNNGVWVVNYPAQQLENGQLKNALTFGGYKDQVRIMKRIENDLVEANLIDELPSYFIECLVYNVHNSQFFKWTFRPLTATLRAALLLVGEATEVGGSAKQWKEVNGIKPLFGEGQAWSMADAHAFVVTAAAHLGLS